ncbi:MAG: hypothetical protein RR735_09355, partial [Bacteroidales bacterium]
IKLSFCHRFLCLSVFSSVRAKLTIPGREEGKLQTAKTMKLEKIPSLVISKCTGLTVEQIDKI